MICSAARRDAMPAAERIFWRRSAVIFLFLSLYFCFLLFFSRILLRKQLRLRLVSRNEFDLPVRSLLGLEGKNKLSIPSLEVLSIVAYRQPVTAPEIAELRGVNSASSLRTLLDKKLITTAGRKEVVGTPFLYKTTKEFLVHFGLADLKDLPRPEDLDALYGVEANTAQTELFPEQNSAEEKTETMAEEEDSENG